MSVWQAILQGIIQGLTEFLPVSSSGHLSIFQYFTGLSGESGAFFSIVLHLGTLFAVVIAFFPTIWGLIQEAFAMLGDLFRGRFSFRRVTPAQDDLSAHRFAASAGVCSVPQGFLRELFHR